MGKWDASKVVSSTPEYPEYPDGLPKEIPYPSGGSEGE